MRQLLGTPASPPPTSNRTCRVDDLQRAGWYRVFTETASGARTKAARRRRRAVRSDGYGGRRRLNWQQHDWV